MKHVRVTKPSRGEVTVLNLFSMPDLSSNSGKQTTADKPPNTSAEHLAKTLEYSEIRRCAVGGGTIQTTHAAGSDFSL